MGTDKAGIGKRIDDRADRRLPQNPASPKDRNVTGIKSTREL